MKVLSTASSTPRARQTLGDLADVGQPQQRVGRRLDPAQLGARGDRRRHRGGIARVGVDEGQPQAAKHLVEEAKRPAVEIVAGDHLVARRQQRQHGRRRRQARVEAEPEGPALQRRQVGLEREARRVLRARVLEAAVLARALLRVRRREEDRRHHRAGDRLGALTGVHRQRLDARAARSGAARVRAPAGRTRSRRHDQTTLPRRSARYSMRSILVITPTITSRSSTTTTLASLKMLRIRWMRVAGDTVA